MKTIIRSLDLDSIREQFLTAEPFRFFKVDDFLEPEFASQLSNALPRYRDAQRVGFEFSAVNEKGKIQITDRDHFPEPAKLLADALNSDSFLSNLSYVTGIRNLVADPQFAGGGIHITGPRGRLDVHVDFNYIRERELHRRLNILIYLNPGWDPKWGGNIEFWDRDVKNCHHSFEPGFNRCVVFETNEVSFHGVTPVTCPTGQSRRSFAAYYYTREAPNGWDGSEHSTIFRARPDEAIKGRILMPAEKLHRGIQRYWHKLKQRIKNMVN